ncbi:outer membrane beta-barrel protein [Microbacter margulisiae]|uniref:Outer membrane protein beta-barrel domain-containing protein n=1 Tax=Microbacter margulisiae TaxID=1350067 RepID=A0A7W5DRR6_9PORP|nr:outer membrane beta-barrel protein [Microbacter margulisiae]MBB3187855.1 hypothetical protein [Microbacter margulisiae]
MKTTSKCIVIVLLMFFSIHVFGQVHFEPGYFISNDGTKTNCLIKNEDWYNNPTEFKYKLLAKAKVQIGKIADITEFAINDYAKYVRADVNVDVSPSQLGELTKFRNPIWEKRILFLKVLVDGKASLYMYRSRTLDNRFFFKCDSMNIKQLVYKEYLRDNTVAVNNTFKLQLNDHVRCESCGVSTGEFPEYYKKDLVNYFIRYNQCVDPSFKVKHITYQRDILHVSLFGGINYSSLTITNSEANYLNGDFKNKLNLHAGINIEYVLPFDKNQWSLFMEPEYDQFTSDVRTVYINHIDYKSLNLSFGIKRYFFLTDKWKLFISGQVHSVLSDNFDSHYSSQLLYTSGTYNYSSSVNYEVKNVPNLAIGIGAEYKRLYLEIRKYTNQNIMPNGGLWTTSFSTFTLNIGYKLFNLSSKGSK